MSAAYPVRKVVVICIALAVGMLHFVTGPAHSGPCPALVNGYLIDILLPFAMFLVIGVANQTEVQGSVFRGTVVFTVGAVSETMQYFGIPVFGRTFDPLDYVMFAFGILLGVLFERMVFTV